KRCPYWVPGDGVQQTIMEKNHGRAVGDAALLVPELHSVHVNVAAGPGSGGGFGTGQGAQKRKQNTAEQPAHHARDCIVPRLNRPTMLGADIPVIGCRAALGLGGRMRPPLHVLCTTLGSACLGEEFPCRTWHSKFRQRKRRAQYRR